MKLDRFINRPVLSTVISVLIVILGIIGLATLPVTQYPDIAPPTVQVTCHLYRCELHSCIEFGHCSVGRPDKRRGEHDVYPVISIQ